ncbi:MAG TPA: hypothetical protein VKG61_08895 [Streptosporangiaceae bacterium]|nr:hypothetical protein [Streptosporangiaceae bacterium]
MKRPCGRRAQAPGAGLLPPPRRGHHSYYFELYALDADLALPAGLDRAEFLARIDDHIIEQARIVGTYSG